MNPTVNLEELAALAVAGQRAAVATLVGALQKDVYALALRMLWNPQDAEDATQEILIRVVTRLGQFDGRSRLKTWVYRVASNYLLDVKKSCIEKEKLTFTWFSDDLREGLSSDDSVGHEDIVLTEEVKLGCALGLLQCLDRPHRLAYVLGEIFEWPAPDAADALGIEPAAFRKRLQRTREAVEAFTREHCGLVSDEAPCRCDRRVPVALRTGRVDPKHLRFARSGQPFIEARELVRRVEDAKQVLFVQQSTNPAGAPRDFAQLISSVLEGEAQFSGSP